MKAIFLILDKNILCLSKQHSKQAGFINISIGVFITIICQSSFLQIALPTILFRNFFNILTTENMQPSIYQLLIQLFNFLK